MSDVEEKILTEEEAYSLGDDATEEDLREGYIKLWRMILKSPVWDNSHLLRVWLWCLIRACHAPRRILMDNKVVTLERGQFVTGRRKTAKACRVTENMAYRLMHQLVEMGNLDISPGRRYSIVTVCKYERYQGNGIPDRQQVRPLVDRSQTTERPLVDTYKNYKNEKNEKKRGKGTKLKGAVVASAPPSLSEVLEYMKQIGCPQPDRNSEKFVAHYSSNGWKQNRGTPIVDWKAAAVKWKYRQEEYESENPRKSETNEERAKRIAKEIKEGK